MLNHDLVIADMTLADVRDLARQGRGFDPKGERAEFLDLVEKAVRLQKRQK